MALVRGEDGEDEVLDRALDLLGADVEAREGGHREHALPVEVLPDRRLHLSEAALELLRLVDIPVEHDPDRLHRSPPGPSAGLTGAVCADTLRPCTRGMPDRPARPGSPCLRRRSWGGRAARARPRRRALPGA